jgi:hypothetical protein
MMLAHADEPDEIERLVSDVARNADATALKATWSLARKKLRELAALEQKTQKLNGRGFFLLTTLESRVGKILKTELPDLRRADIAEEARRRKAAARRQALECCAVLNLEPMVTRAELELAAPAQSTVTFGKYWDDQAKRRAQ